MISNGKKKKRIVTLLKRQGGPSPYNLLGRKNKNFKKEKGRPSNQEACKLLISQHAYDTVNWKR